MSVIKDRVVYPEDNSIKKPKAQKMSPSRLRSFDGFENISDKEAQQTINTLEQFCETIYKHITKNDT